MTIDILNRDTCSHVAAEPQTKTCINVFCRRPKTDYVFNVRNVFRLRHTDRRFAVDCCLVSFLARLTLLEGAIAKCHSVCLSVCHTREYAVQGIEIEILFTPNFTVLSLGVYPEQVCYYSVKGRCPLSKATIWPIICNNLKTVRAI